MTDSPNSSRDPDDMLGHVLSWPDLLAAGDSHTVDLPDSLRDRTSIVCCGMGGSAIGASIVGEHFAGELPVPLVVVRDYDLPAFMNERTLVICLSYSGGTEETLEAYSQARRAGAAVMVVSTGGELIERAWADTVPAVTYEGGGQPRAALPFTLGLLTSILSKLGYIADQSASVETAVEHLRELIDSSAVRERATDQARQLVGKIPIIYGAGFLGEPARRLKGQVSENGKQTAAWETLPEQNHNALVGYEFPKNLPDQAIFVLLRSDLEHARHRLRFDVTNELLSKRGLPFLELQATGANRFTQACSILFQGDLLSVELAYLNQVDPTPVDVIGILKDRLKDAV